MNEGRANDKAIHVILLDASTGQVVSSGPESSLKLEVVVLMGHFDPGNAEGWTREDFEAFIAKKRQGMRPLLIGDLQVKLENGVATIEKLQFTDNSSWTWNKKFQIGIRVAPGCSTTSMRIQEAKTEPFSVLSHRGEPYKKHTPPVPNDEVWRLKRIAKGGAIHKQLSEEKIFTVEDFLRCLSTDSNKLQHIRGRRLCEKAWKEMVEHARTCRPNGKCYICYTDETQRCGLIGNNFFQFIGTIADGKISTEESIPHEKKVYLERAWKQACENPNQLVECDSVVFMHDLANTQSNQSPEEHSMCLATNAIPTVDRGGILQFKHVIQDKNAEAGQYPTMVPVKVLDNCIHVSEVHRGCTAANDGFMDSLIFPKEEFSQDEQGCMTPAVPMCHAYGSTSSPSQASSSAPDHMIGRDCLASTTNPYYDVSYFGRLDHGLSLDTWQEDFPVELFLRSCIQGTGDIYDDSSNFKDSPDSFL